MNDVLRTALAVIPDLVAFIVRALEAGDVDALNRNLAVMLNEQQLAHLTKTAQDQKALRILGVTPTEEDS